MFQFTVLVHFNPDQCRSGVSRIIGLPTPLINLSAAYILIFMYMTPYIRFYNVDMTQCSSVFYIEYELYEGKAGYIQ